MNTPQAPPSQRRPGQAATAPQPKPKRMSLSSATDRSPRQPGRILIYGAPGIGKTSIAAAFPNPIFLLTRGEDGLVNLINHGRVQPAKFFAQESGLPQFAETWEDVIGAIEELLAVPHDHKTFVLDTMNGAERLCHEHVCRRDYAGNWGESGFVGYHRGYGTAVNDWRQLLQLLTDLGQKRGMTVVSLLHSSVRDIPNPMGARFEQWIPALHKSTWEATAGWCNMILFAQQRIFVSDDVKGRRGKAHTGGRVLCCTGAGPFESKNQHGLPDEIEMGNSGAEAFANLVAAVKLNERKE